MKSWQFSLRVPAACHTSGQALPYGTVLPHLCDLTQQAVSFLLYQVKKLRLRGGDLPKDRWLGFKSQTLSPNSELFPQSLSLWGKGRLQA